MPVQETHKDLHVHPFKNYAQWLSWLKKNHKQTQGIWLKFAKKNSGVPSITYEEAREGAIIYGWIDGLINRYDDTYYLTKFTPRRPRSRWSKINRGIAEELIQKKKIKPSGMLQVLAAKKDGRWDLAYDSQTTITVPEELKKLLETHKTANKNFENLNSVNRYAFLYRIHNAKREETKQKHIEKAFEMLKKGELYHPSPKKKTGKKKPTRTAKKKK